MGKEPVFKAAIGTLSVAVWENETKNSEGKMRTYHAVNMERSYKDADGEWKKTNQLNGRDLGNAIALLQKVQSEVLVN